MARVPVALAFVAAGTAVGTFFALEFGSFSSSVWRLYLVSGVVLWLCVALSLVVVRQVSAAAWVGQVAAGLAAVAFVIVGFVDFYGAAPDYRAAFDWVGEARLMGVAALAFGLAGDRVRTPAIRAVFFGLVTAVVACLVYMFRSGGGAGRLEYWSIAATTIALLAASAAARTETIRLRTPR